MGGADCLSVPTKKKQHKGKMSHKHTVDGVLEDLRYKKKTQYTVHTVATIIVQTAKYSWSVEMYRPVLA